MSKQRFTVRIRRDIGREVRPEAEQLDGKTYTFTYPGEQAWLPRDSTYPVGAPPWIASGDLEETK